VQRVCHDTLPWLISFSLDLVRVAVPLALLLTFAASVDALEFAYYTSLRNDSGQSIEVIPDVIHGRWHYTVQPGQTLVFLGGFSTERFVIRTPKHTFAYTFPFRFGAQPTSYRGRQRHSFVFTREHVIYPLDPAGAMAYDAAGFPLTPRSPSDLINR
jgi:hypothetical protein